MDINVAADREQWWPGAPTIDLNPQGRTQNKKYRALVPVLPTLDRWLRAEYATFMDLKPEDRAGRGWLVNYHGRPVQDVDRAWDAMLTKLGLPTVLDALEVDRLHLGRPKFGQDFRDKMVRLRQGFSAIAHRLGCVFHENKCGT
ncbi:hypothetical protein ASF00_04405 [Sphingomonas sp. Leaf34]|uniref:hypothetical protein n=1 Tax=Sphingomonas sp. Leaf34 TaxID=1736216 RepID=UPI0006FAD2A8|nr:hypothetical protein [Sphingomonas sp. Leaf34]KQN32000.1 hypothetical protein ASF00_04405 [Sphingomonas sp. Leaf34]